MFLPLLPGDCELSFEESFLFETFGIVQGFVGAFQMIFFGDLGIFGFREPLREKFRLADGVFEGYLAELDWEVWRFLFFDGLEHGLV